MEEDKQSAKGFNPLEKEFKLKRNVDKSKAKNPKKKAAQKDLNSSYDKEDLVSNLDMMESSFQNDK
jgi:hypothetical protein